VKNVSGKRDRENRNAHFVFNNWLSKIVPFTIERTAGQAADDNVTRAHFMLDT
jgi:hypothetical protein